MPTRRRLDLAGQSPRPLHRLNMAAVLSRCGVAVVQTNVLVKKNLLLIRRKWFATFFQVYFLPLFVLLLTINIRNFTKGPPGRGLGSPAPVLSLRESIQRSDKDFVILAGDTLGPDVAPVIDKITKPLTDISQRVRVFQTGGQLNEHCRTDLRDVHNCLAVVVFDDSPLTAGGTRTWNYTIRTSVYDRAGSQNVFRHDSSVDRLWFPLMKAVEGAITNTTGEIQSYAFSYQTQEEVDNRNRQLFLMDFIGIFVSQECKRAK
jgi:ATP-binding cassette, subfamily A (ABC1), member 3